MTEAKRNLPNLKNLKKDHFLLFKIQELDHFSEPNKDSLKMLDHFGKQGICNTTASLELAKSPTIQN